MRNSDRVKRKEEHQPAPLKKKGKVVKKGDFPAEMFKGWWGDSKNGHCEECNVRVPMLYCAIDECTEMICIKCASSLPLTCNICGLCKKSVGAAIARERRQK